MWVVAVGLMLAEFLLFDRMTSRHHASIYPRWNDQIQYLSESYQAYEQMQAHGMVAALKSTLTKTALQGTLHDFFAVLVFRLAGSASRSAALSLNMLAFLAWQAALLFTVPRVTGSRAAGWMAFGLLLCVAWPWSGEAASAVDFRLDHGAMCLLGITSAVALLTDGFRSIGWTIALGVVTGLTLLERFLTGVYFGAIFVASVVWILCGDARGLRLRNLGFAGLAATALALPIFWVNREAIRTYYWVGHITGAEGAARGAGLDLGHSFAFIFGRLADMQLGSYFGWTAAALTAGLLLLFLAGRRRPGEPARSWLFFPLAFLLLPAAVLGVHPQKSAYVLGVLVPGALLLVVWVWAALWRRTELPTAGWRHHAPVVLALAALAGGERYFILRQLWEPHTPEFLASAREANAITDHIFAASRRAGLANPVIGVDQVVDFVDAQILTVMCYERHKVWIPFVNQLPPSILAEADEIALHKLTLCDFVLLTDQMAGNGHWPFDQQMRRLHPQVKEWCENHLRLTRNFTLFDRQMSLYEHRESPLAVPALTP